MGSSHNLFITLLVILLLLLSCSFLVASNHPCLEDQSLALLQMKQSFSIDCSSAIDKDCCSWDGITCDSNTGHVIGLNLNNCLSGCLASNNSLFHLLHLQKLTLIGNDFNLSPIPSEFGTLTRLTHLNLSDSVFSGQIPVEISQLTNLVSLDLSRNYGLKLSHPGFRTLIQHHSTLRELNLAGVDMSAEVNYDWAQTVSLALPELRVLSFLQYLSELYLDSNNFSPTVPDFLGSITSLTSLHLSNCRFYGEFPRNIFQLPKLQSLLISFNPELTGYLPEFPQNSALRFLDVHSTKLHGKLPHSLGNLKFLIELDLSNCSFKGPIPPSVVNLTHLESLDLSSNLLSGQIQSSLFYLPSLLELHLYANQFTSIVEEPQHSNYSFTSSFCFDSSISPSPSVSLLEDLQLNNNQLRGKIPRFIFHLTCLLNLNISSNYLSDVVDFDMFNATHLSDLDISNSGLWFTNNNRANSTSPQLYTFFARSCNISEFPDFLRYQETPLHIDLSNNKISGKIPSWIWKFSLRTMNLSHNLLTGIDLVGLASKLPLQMFVLDLHSNQIQEESPSENYFSRTNSTSLILGNISSYLLGESYQGNPIEFSISDNKLTGRIPPTICDSSFPNIFDLSNNQLGGRIPECLTNFSNSVVLNLRGNNFHGTIPQNFIGGNLRSLNLNNNQLEGNLPRSLVNCKSLEVLDLGNNLINDTFPSWLGGLPKLRVLVLRSNKFHGSIRGPPRAENGFPMLHIIDLSFNSFTGHLPSKYFQSLKAMIAVKRDKSSLRYIGDSYYQDSVKVTIKGQEVIYGRIIEMFTTIDLSGNAFEGEIPQALGNLKSLMVLNLSRNCLAGQIPSALGHLTQLESLDLSQNKLSGQIPVELVDLTFLSVLNLARNNLSGSIPQGRQFGTFENTSYAGNLGLCGPPLSRKCELDDATTVHQNSTSGFSKQEKEDLASIILDWKFLALGYGSGVIVGVIIGWKIIPNWRIEAFFKLTSRKRRVHGGR
uniref:Receptor-like protein 12 n=1 Tax=Nelumbo nucifera TaxID=4432 RepID=A0A822Y4M1_NELNU|nr:TPA_asm: hypothetical protein HUJ06_028690 [Nelumbo nucifera]